MIETTPCGILQINQAYFFFRYLAIKILIKYKYKLVYG